MNAYIASFMLLLFNAVGIAVPASAATVERVGTQVALSETDALQQCAGSRFSGFEASAYYSPASRHSVLLTVTTADQNPGNSPIWTVLAIRAESGDKLEHVEGAP